MSSMNNLNSIFAELNFSQNEQEGFNQAILIAKDYLRNGDIDMEKEFKAIVEKVVQDEI